MKPRFVWIIGAIREVYPDIPEALTCAPGIVLWDRQERRTVMKVARDYANLICLEHKDHGTPFTDLETWVNGLDNVSLESENIAPTIPTT